jgi:hypothetical protein
MKDRGEYEMDIASVETNSMMTTDHKRNEFLKMIIELLLDIRDKAYESKK